MYSVGYLKTQGVVDVEFSKFGNNFTVKCVPPNNNIDIISVEDGWKCISSNGVEAKFEGPYSYLTPEMILAHLSIWIEVTQVEDERRMLAVRTMIGSEEDSEGEEDSEDEEEDSEGEEDSDDEEE